MPESPIKHLRLKESSGDRQEDQNRLQRIVDVVSRTGHRRASQRLPDVLPVANGCNSPGWARALRRGRAQGTDSVLAGGQLGRLQIW